MIPTELICHGGFAMVTAMEVARYLLHLNNEEPENDPLTHMRLQKLLYYCQGWFLGMRDAALFDDRIEAWTHGPVVPNVYRMFADYDGDPIPRHQGRDAVEIASDHKDFIKRIWDHYKRFSATELRRMTHNEQPWLNARGDRSPDDRTDAEITDDAMRSYFGQQRRLAATSLQRARDDFQSGRSVTFDELLAEFA
jgi:uncharacterized phage-associated protein